MIPVGTETKVFSMEAWLLMYSVCDQCGTVSFSMSQLHQDITVDPGFMVVTEK